MNWVPLGWAVSPSEIDVMPFGAAVAEVGHFEIGGKPGGGLSLDFVADVSLQGSLDRAVC